MEGKKLILGLIVLILITSIFVIQTQGKYTYELKPFKTYHQILKFFRNNIGEIFVYMGEITKNAGSQDFSRTNIQVEGVDEPDFVKTDGEYIYMVTNQKIYIVKAYPNASISSKIFLDIEPISIFINKEYLIVFCHSYGDIKYKNYSRSFPTTFIKIYNVSDRKNPKLIEDIEIDGRYFGARMLDDYFIF